MESKVKFTAVYAGVCEDYDYENYRCKSTGEYCDACYMNMRRNRHIFIPNMEANIEGATKYNGKEENK